MEQLGVGSGAGVVTQRLPWMGLWVCVASGCSQPTPVQREQVDWRPGEVARVGGGSVALQLVERVASSQGREPGDALERVTRTWLVGQAFERQAPELAVYLARTVLARRMEETWAQEARAAGEPTDDEVATFTKLHWFELDRPRLVRTSHAVVRVEKDELRGSARATAQELRAAVLGSTSAEEFRERAKSFTSDKHQIRVEALGPVALDGRVPPVRGARGDGVRYDREFARAAHELTSVGEVSAVSETAFGFHVIFLSEVLPEQRVPLPERRETLRSEILAQRAREFERAALETARGRVAVELGSDALTLMERVAVTQ